MKEYGVFIKGNLCYIGTVEELASILSTTTEVIELIINKNLCIGEVQRDG